MKKQATIILFLLSTFSLFSQTADFVKTEGIINPLHQNNIGKITFMGDYISYSDYKESDFLTSFEMKENENLGIRTFLGNSLTNYIHPLAPELSAEELTKQGNYQFTFYVDGQLIYTENLNVGAGSPEYKNKMTIFRVPLISKEREDSWGRFLWGRFMVNGGQDALTTGKHQLKIEIRPYVETTNIKVGDIIATGDIQLIVPPVFVSEKDIAIQAIAPKSGWEISKDNYDKEKIRALNQKIGEKVFKDIEGIVVIKDNKLLIEEYFNDSKRKTLHNPRSVGKTFAATALGIAIEEGYIKDENQTLKEFYDLKKFKNYSPEKGNVTLKNLLTMTAGFDGSDMDYNSPGNEENMYPTDNWVKFTLDLGMDNSQTPGKDWDYFTAGVVVLGDILHQSVPGGLKNYADEKLFKPLGIKKYKWQYTPQKVANTAGGIQLRALDFAKFGQLYKNDGLWNGQQILPKQWVEDSFSHQAAIPDTDDEFYGYLFWNKTFEIDGKSHEVYYASGNGGNKIYVFQDLPLVIVITATAYNTAYGHRQVDKMMEEYLLPAVVD
jgi:CubicO group peptidase (beta-lactamase class C family)